MKRIACIGLACLTLLGCSPKEKEIKIALAVPLTGDIATLGQGMRRASALALEEAVAAGRLKGMRVRIVDFDDRSDPKEAVNVANRIAADPSMIAVIGHFNSGCSIPASSVYARAGVAMVSPGSSNPELTRQQLSPNWRWPRNVFRVCTTDDVQGAYAAETAAGKLKAKTAVVIHDKTAYGQGIAEEFQKRFTQLGGTVKAFDGAPLGEKDFKALITRIKPLEPHVVYFGGQFDVGGLLLRQAREAGLAVPFITGEINYDPEFLRIAGPAAEGAYVTFLGRPPALMASAKEFIDRYHQRYPSDEVKAYDHYTYEITQMILDSLEKVGPDRAAIREALRTIHHTGILGETSFDEKGDTLNKTVTLFVVKNGAFVPVE